jgi:uncharacterized protein (TIGR02246 family)
MTTTASRTIIGLGLIVLVAVLSVPLGARLQDPTEAELRRLSESYAQAWAKGDARAVTTHYTADAIRVGPDGSMAVGRARIEQALSQALNGPYRGSKIKVTYGQTTRAAQDAYVTEATVLVGGGMPPKGMPTHGRLMQTLVRSSGRWFIAGEGALIPPAGK